MVNEKKISSGFIYFFGAFAGILFGYDIGVMRGLCLFCKMIGTFKTTPGLLDGLPLR